MSDNKSVSGPNGHKSSDAHDGEETSHFNRREFMVGAVALGAAATIPIIAKALPSMPEVAESALVAPLPVIRSLRGHFKINGQNHEIEIDPRETVLDLLRERLELTGTKKGCDHGQCGACTVLIDGKRVNSCLSLAAQNQNKTIVSIEGLAAESKLDSQQLHPMQEAFIKHDAFQCGFCTPGQIMSAVALIKEPCGPSNHEVRECMSGNICRCGAYQNILAAIQEVRGIKGPDRKESNHATV